MYIVFFQLTANGESLENGEDAHKHAVKAYKQERDEWCNWQGLVDRFALDILQSPGLATLKNVQVT